MRWGTTSSRLSRRAAGSTRWIDIPGALVATGGRGGGGAFPASRNTCNDASRRFANRPAAADRCARPTGPAVTEPYRTIRLRRKKKRRRPPLRATRPDDQVLLLTACRPRWPAGRLAAGRLAVLAVLGGRPRQRTSSRRRYTPPPPRARRRRRRRAPRWQVPCDGRSWSWPMAAHAAAASPPPRHIRRRSPVAQSVAGRPAGCGGCGGCGRCGRWCAWRRRDVSSAAATADRLTGPWMEEAGGDRLMSMLLPSSRGVRAVRQTSPGGFRRPAFSLGGGGAFGWGREGSPGWQGWTGLVGWVGVLRGGRPSPSCEEPTGLRSTCRRDRSTAMGDITPWAGHSDVWETAAAAA